MNRKIKVAYICEFTNPKVQSHLRLKVGLLELIVRKLKGGIYDVSQLASEYGIWITNAIAEYEKFSDDIELHVISPHGWMQKRCQEFCENNIYYYFFINEDCLFFKKILQKLISPIRYSLYKKNRKYIRKFLRKINPDIVYISGAENPKYSLAALDISNDIPVVVHLQTLMNDPIFESNYPIEHNMYTYRAKNELKVLKRADYIFTTVEKYENRIKTLIPNAMILHAKLALEEKVQINKIVKKQYDFVYFAANISKAVDLAIEAFAIALQKQPKITLLIVGEYDDEYKWIIDKRINELEIKDNVFFTGRLKSHQDVIATIQKARIALLPLKIDIISGTIREAMACGLPVVTTITEGGTSKLNEERESVLLSEIGDHNALANNMLKLLENSNLVKLLTSNGIKTVKEKYSNYSAVHGQKECLFDVYNHFYMQKNIQGDLFL